MRGKSLLWMPLAAMLIISMSVISAIGTPTPVVYISPSVSTANPGEEFTFDINIENVVGLWGWEVMISFDLGITPYKIMEYDGPGGMKELAGWLGINTVFNYAKKPGYILVSCVFEEPAWIDGSFQLANVTMLALEPEATTLHFDYVRLFDVQGNMMDYTPVDGVFYTPVRPTLTHVPLFPVVGEEVTFNAILTPPIEDYSDIIASCVWDFGDGSAPIDECTSVKTHTYTAADRYTVTLTITYADPVPSTVMDQAQVQLDVFAYVGYFEGNLIMKRVDPNRRPRLGETMTFVGKAENLELSEHDLYVKVVFDIITEEGETITMETNIGGPLAPGEETSFLTVDWTPEEVGRYFGIATAWYSLNEITWGSQYTGTKIKTFSFEVRP